ncbi:MAG: leucyl aminopeptidase [Bacteroidetes bacterium]|nr:leucyl aminopeptidase [Bacteroidota bacterium]
MTNISKKSSINNNDSVVLLCGKNNSFNNYGLTKPEIDFIKNEIKIKDKKAVCINQLHRLVIVQLIDVKKEKYQTVELLRKAASTIHTWITDAKIETISVLDAEGKVVETLAFAEGLALTNYQFLKYKKDKDKEAYSLKSITVVSKGVSPKQIEELNIVVEATCISRTLVNEPVNFLTATQLSKEFQKLGKEAGFNVEVFNKEKIKALKMGGLLSVNMGSVEPPTFSIMEYKPRNAKNKQPIILVGKGVVYDTGGLSLKPTPNSMDMMKCDMAGSAAVAGTMYAIAKSKLPVYVIGLVPATDNRPGGNAYVPGDVITMHNGMTVEMLNADAEGRMILADALSYAQKYDPKLVIDLATLTGAAVAAIGTSGIVAMGTADERTKNKLKQSGNSVFERLAEMPFWDDYDELIKSDIADMKNIGGPYAGSITAGKFLARYTKYPWMHLDIAGPAFLTAKDNYRVKGGTGVGVRLLFDYFKNNA